MPQALRDSSEVTQRQRAESVTGGSPAGVSRTVVLSAVVGGLLTTWIRGLAEAIEHASAPLANSATWPYVICAIAAVYTVWRQPFRYDKKAPATVPHYVAQSLRATKKIITPPAYLCVVILAVQQLFDGRLPSLIVKLSVAVPAGVGLAFALVLPLSVLAGVLALTRRNAELEDTVDMLQTDRDAVQRELAARRRQAEVDLERDKVTLR